MISTQLDKGDGIFALRSSIAAISGIIVFLGLQSLLLYFEALGSLLSNVLYSLNMVELGLMFAHIIKPH